MIMSVDEWNILSDALRILSPALGAWAVYLLRQVLGQLKTLNGRVTTIEGNCIAHKILENVRFTDVQRQLDKGGLHG